MRIFLVISLVFLLLNSAISQPEEQLIEVKLGDSVTLHCDLDAASGGRARFYLWRGPNSLYRPMERSLVLHYVRSKDLGRYVCLGRVMNEPFQSLSVYALREPTYYSSALKPAESRSQEMRISRADFMKSDKRSSGCEPHSVVCGTMNGRPPLNECVLKHWLCDGQDDCGNNWDEQFSLCDDAVRPQPPECHCKKNEICCPSRPSLCIPRSYSCDTYKDCPLDDDDEGVECCTLELLEGARVENNEVNLIESLNGEPVELVCRASSLEQPTINWRFNGTHVPKEYRIKETSNSIWDEITHRYIMTSTLFIPRMNRALEGIFNCEVINKCKRSFSVDYQLRQVKYIKKTV